ncbi:MAG: flagellar motor switch protein FliG [Alphaproteobacteria bacterium]|nr:MAG: flagellar motor switch protein FliG [Alphaproteobacteria bacterium]
MTGVQKSAIMFLCLGEDLGGALMQQLDEAEIRAITRAISDIGEVRADVVEQVMDEFGQSVATYGGVTGSVSAAKNLLKSFLPEERVTEILGEIQNENGKNLWKELSKLEEKELAGLLAREQDQTAAVILSQLEPDCVAKVLPLLGEERAGRIVERMLTLDELSEVALRTIEESLQGEVLAKAGKGAGAKVESKLVSVFNKIDTELFERIASTLEKTAPEQIQAIRKQMFVFDDMVKISPMDLPKIMREVSGNTLPLALRGAKKEVREHFLSSLPARSRDMLADEMKALGPVRLRDVKVAQAELVEAAIRLAQDGEIELPGPEGDEEEMI